MLNHGHRHRGFVYQQARFGPDKRKPRSGRPTAGGLGGGLLGVHQPAAGLRSSPERCFCVHSSVGLSGFPAVPHCAAWTAELWRGGRGRFPGAMVSTR